MGTQLYKDKKFTSWSIGRIAEALCDEWKDLNPELDKNIVIYERKSTQISFKGEVNVALDITRQRFPEKDLVQMYFGLSLSPVPYDLKTHALNTFDMASFVGLFPELHGKHFFTISKTEPWDGSLFSKTAAAMKSVIEAMLHFESCFHLLLDDTFEIDGVTLDSTALSLSHHLNQAKAYWLAAIYDHPEKLDEAIDAIKRFGETNELTKGRLQDLRAAGSGKGTNWLYTPEMVAKL